MAHMCPSNGPTDPAAEPSTLRGRRSGFASVEVALVAQAVVHFRESDESSTSARDPSPRGVVALAERIGRAHLGDRRWGALVAVVVAAAAGLIAGWWTPRGPVNATQALAAMAMGLTVGVIAGITMRSRWAMLLAPAVFMGIFEAVRIEATGPTVDAIDLGSFAGSAAFTVGRFFQACSRCCRCWSGWRSPGHGCSGAAPAGRLPLRFGAAQPSGHAEPAPSA